MSKRWPWPCGNCLEPDHTHVRIPGTATFQCPFAPTTFEAMDPRDYVRHCRKDQTARQEATRTGTWHERFYGRDTWEDRTGNRRRAANRELENRRMLASMKETYDEKNSLAAKSLASLLKEQPDGR